MFCPSASALSRSCTVSSFHWYNFSLICFMLNLLCLSHMSMRYLLAAMMHQNLFSIRLIVCKTSWSCGKIGSASPVSIVKSFKSSAMGGCALEFLLWNCVIIHTHLLTFEDRRKSCHSKAITEVVIGLFFRNVLIEAFL